MADRDTFFAQCEQCKAGTVGWLIAQLVETAAEEYGNGLQSIVIENSIHFGAGDANPNLDFASIVKGEDGSICIELTGMSRPPTTIPDGMVVVPDSDTARWNWVASEYLHLVPFDMPTGGGDVDVGWSVLQSTNTGDVEIYRHYFDDPRGAIDGAIAAAPGSAEGG